MGKQNKNINLLMVVGCNTKNHWAIYLFILFSFIFLLKQVYSIGWSGFLLAFTIWSISSGVMSITFTPSWMLKALFTLNL